MIVDNSELRYVESTGFSEVAPENWVAIDIDGKAVATGDPMGISLAIVDHSVAGYGVGEPPVRGYYVFDGVGGLIGINIDNFSSPISELVGGASLIVSLGKLKVDPNGKVARVEYIEGDTIHVRLINLIIPSTGATTALMNGIDENHDGVITRSEILDANADGTNSWQDIGAIATDNVVD